MRAGPDGPGTLPLPAADDRGAVAPGSAGPAKTSISVLKKRAGYLACARARRAHAAGLILQGRQRREGEPSEADIRVGFTCSKKVGKAVDRNRAKRRLRALAAEVLPDAGRPGWDYVLIGRAGVTAARPFALMADDLRGALRKVHGGRR